MARGWIEVQHFDEQRANSRSPLAGWRFKDALYAALNLDRIILILDGHAFALSCYPRILRLVLSAYEGPNSTSSAGDQHWFDTDPSRCGGHSDDQVCLALQNRGAALHLPEKVV